MQSEKGALICRVLSMISILYGFSLFIGYRFGIEGLQPLIATTAGQTREGQSWFFYLFFIGLILEAVSQNIKLKLEIERLKT